MVRPSRERALEALRREVFDLLVIGGGITGARVAYEAASAGLRIALVDAGDFAGETSGASAGLIHGGLRYLRTGAISLVRTAQRERHALSARIAPHLIRPLPFVLAIPGGRTRRVSALAALHAYSALGGFHGPPPRAIAPEQARLLVPPLRARGIGHALFEEAETNDARLTLATVIAASRAGAEVANHMRVVDLDLAPEGVSCALTEGRPGEGLLTVRYRAVVNATGPWVDHMRRLEEPGCFPIARLSKGTHVVLRLPERWTAAVAASLESGRHLYAVPRDGVIFLGTTDSDYHGDPGAVAPTPDEVSYLLEGASAFLNREALRGEAVISAFAGLRVLPRAMGTSYETPREHVIGVGPGGMVSVAGGKLTTHRVIALDALHRLPPRVRPRRLALRDDPLPGAQPAPVGRLRMRLGRAVTAHLLRLYGGEAGKLLDYAATFPDALERISPLAPDIWAQVHHAVREEWALTVNDVVRRRTTLGVRGLDTPPVRARVSRLLESRGRGDTPDWRTWNLSRSRAFETVQRSQRPPTANINPP